MSEDDDTPSRPLALTLFLGAGSLGMQVTHALATLLEQAPEACRRRVATCAMDADEKALRAAVDQLRSTENIRALGKAGFRSAELDLGGIPVRIQFVFVGDVESSASEAATIARKVLEAVNVTRFFVAAQLTPQPSSEFPAGEWDLVLSFSREAETGLVQPDDAFVAGITRTLLVLAALAPQGPLGTNAPAGATPLLRVDGSFAEAHTESLKNRLCKRIVAGILQQQFESVRPYDPAAAFDDPVRTVAESRLDPVGLAQGLLLGIPFVLDDSQHPPCLVPKTEETAIPLHGVPSRKWMQILRRLKQVYDFTKARSWRESLEANAARLADVIDETFGRDLALLYRYPRSVDRILVWSKRAKDRVHLPEAFEPMPGKDFEPAITALRQAVAAFPHWLPLSATVLLLSLLGARGALAVVESSYGVVAGTLAFALVLLVGALSGVSWHQSVHGHLMQARTAAVHSLAVHFARQVGENLLRCLGELRQNWLGALEGHHTRAEAFAKEAVRQAEAAAAAAANATQASDETVLAILSAEHDLQVLESLRIDWAAQSAHAAEQEFLSPTNDTPPTVDLTALTDYARTILGQRTDQLRLAAQIALRETWEPRFLESTRKLLEERRTALSHPGNGSTLWYAPGDVLERIRDTLPNANNSQVETFDSFDLEIIASLQVRQVQDARRSTT